MIERIRQSVRDARRRGAGWVRLADSVRAIGSSDGRALLWTRLAHRRALHQTSGYTAPDRYPALFDLAAQSKREARRILSFGCSTGEELEAIRRRFPEAEIVGAEINPRSRRIARERMRSDPAVRVVGPHGVTGRFDLIFALAVLQVQPHRIADAGIDDLTGIYPFARFEGQLLQLVAQLTRDGMLCVFNAQYRVEDSVAAALLKPVAKSPPLDHPIFGKDGKRLPRRAVGRSLFRRR